MLEASSELKAGSGDSVLNQGLPVDSASSLAVQQLMPSKAHIS